MNTTLDRFGRIVIPKQMRDGLGLQPGITLRIEEREDEIRLKPLREGSPTHEKDGILVFSGEAAGDLVGAVGASRESRLARVGMIRAKKRK